MAPPSTEDPRTGLDREETWGAVVTTALVVTGGSVETDVVICSVDVWVRVGSEVVEVMSGVEVVLGSAGVEDVLISGAVEVVLCPVGVVDVVTESLG
jgi:hypothetical protein